MQNLKNNLKIRRDYSKIKSALDIPDLIQMQKQSYEKFLQLGISSENRSDIGLQCALKTIFPIHSNDGRFTLEFLEYTLEEPKYTINDSRKKSTNYAAPVKLKLRLISNDINKETGTVSVSDIKEQEVYLCNLPLMTNNATFIINGTERVIVSQIYRSPGIFFDNDRGKNVNGKLLYNASIIPHVGSWLDIEFDSKDLLHIRIDKRKKIPLTALLKSLDSKATEDLRKKAHTEGKVLSSELVNGMDNDEILSVFYDTIVVENLGDGSFDIDYYPDFYKSRKLSFDLKNSETGDVLVPADTTISTAILIKLSKQNIKKVNVAEIELHARYLANAITDSSSNVLFPAGTEITAEVLEVLANNNIKKFNILLIDNINIGQYMLNTLLNDKIENRFKALNEVYLAVKSSDAPNLEAAEDLFQNLFFNSSRYDLSEVGRVKINERLCINETESRVLEKHDILSIIKVLLRIRDGHESVDDIDHLGNRKVRSVGELVENEIRIAMVRMERSVQERMNASVDIMPSDVVNVKSVQSVLREFFGSSQLSQFMDQTNPLSEITHKRRLSALGPKGLARDRASFEVRDVHVTHYGRICPIETPEGPNIGLINSLAVFAKINKYGFLETPYRKIIDSVVTDEIVYMNATQEGKYAVAQSTADLDENGRFTQNLVNCRMKGELVLLPAEEVQYMDVSPKQLVSVAASLVPFLENDDANRALMGANMQRQAVPLLKTEAPIVGTGMEGIVARDSGVVVIARRGGVVRKVDAANIIISSSTDISIDNHGVDVYNLKKFQRSNHNTCVNQKPVVQVGDVVKAGDIIADGHSIDSGELALGKNVLVAFMPWNGYNFEDSILISEKIVHDDVFTSVHIEEFEVVARDTKLGAEEITADIPNMGDEALKNLDESGIIYVGAEVKQGDILVGKVTPKAESVVTAEEKLLRAIFGEKSVDVKDTSLRVPSGITGTVVDVRVFSRRGLEKDSRTKTIEREYIDQLKMDRDEEYSIIASNYSEQVVNLLDGSKIVSSSKHATGDIVSKEELFGLSLSQLLHIEVEDQSLNSSIRDLSNLFEQDIEKLNYKFEDRKEKLKQGDDLSTGVLKIVKVFLAVKRKLQPGDKMAGRHGNKGVVSKILPIEDMPHLEDGTPVDICLNPLGVPSRMNVGQILEVHMGWACKHVGQQVNEMVQEYYSNGDNINEIREYLLNVYGHNEVDQIKSLSNDQIISLAKNIKKGMPVATPVFDGIRENDIDDLLSFCKLDHSGQVQLIDGRTGEPFERKVTVGYIYMLKLHHLVDDKMHARSIGPYSLITQQPLGGKAQFGGQRFGEMEVWALEAYGAAYILQEMLTVKSDDQEGRTQVYESIVKGEETFETGIPESFNVLVKELRSLCLNLEMKKLD